MKKQLEMEIPTIPKFIKAKITVKGYESSIIDIADFTDDELKEIGREWTEALIEDAQERRIEQKRTDDNKQIFSKC